MNIVLQLLHNFYKQEMFSTTLLVIICIILNVVQTNGISTVTANIINSLKKNNESTVNNLFILFVVLSLAYLVLFYFFKIYQNKIMTSLRQWIRNELVRLLILTNNENFSEQNFIKMNSPINRMSSVCFMVTNDIITFIMPTFIFIIVIGGYFFWSNMYLGLFFMISNLAIFLYIYLTWESTLHKNDEYEKQSSESEFYLLEILNNIDKIIYRGQSEQEINHFDDLSNKTIKKAYEFYEKTNDNSIILNLAIYLVVFVFIFYNMKLFYENNMSLVLFITLFSIIILYRDRMSTFVQIIPDFIEFIGRSNSVLNHFDDFKVDDADINKKYTEVDLPFDVITFENVTFKYKNGDRKIFDNFSYKLYTKDHKIIGLTGLSGRGKSSFAKLFLKMYNHYEGNIYIDGVNIRDIDANYIRKNITYVNQNSKLFDKKIIENMMYGCSHEETCHTKIKEIMEKYPKVAELFNNIDIYTKKTGPLGEHLSGGQRQIVNMIGGLINPSKILVLDEPTNALDPGLKKDLLKLIKDFRDQKKAIIIITHDQEVHELFDEKIEM
jgi:ABC-type bacteriocin/lantibiotic exporter with double-glycine peptidase domain